MKERLRDFSEIIAINLIKRKLLKTTLLWSEEGGL